jgi:hypothetical protein
VGLARTAADPEADGNAEPATTGTLAGTGGAAFDVQALSSKVNKTMAGPIVRVLTIALASY